MERIDIKGWKGKGDIQFLERGNQIKIVEHRKNKETDEVYSEEHIIPSININNLLKIIQTNCDVNTEYKYKYLVRKLLEFYKFHEKENVKLEMFMEAFNGGTNRAKYYFPYYYYPIKYLEAKGLVSYLGRGGIIRLG